MMNAPNFLFKSASRWSVVGTLLGMMSVNNASAIPVQSTTDLWDTSNGTTVTAGTVAISGFALSNMFGTVGIAGDAILTDSASTPANGYFVEWTTPSAVTVVGFNLFLAHDRGAQNLTGVKTRDARARGVSQFSLFADPTGTGGSFTQLYQANIMIVDGGEIGTQPGGLSTPSCLAPGTGCPDPVYGGATATGPVQAFLNVTPNTAGAMTISGDIVPTTASLYRAEFTRFGIWDDPVFAPIRGPRVIELDGFSTPQVIPIPAAYLLFASGLAGLGLLVRRRRACVSGCDGER